MQYTLAKRSSKRNVTASELIRFSCVTYRCGKQTDNGSVQTKQRVYVRVRNRDLWGHLTYTHRLGDIPRGRALSTTF